MTDMPDRIWVSGNGSWHAVGDGVWASDTEYVRADLSSLAALAMREAAIDASKNSGKNYYMIQTGTGFKEIFPGGGAFVMRHQITDAIHALPVPSEAEILAAALKVPGIAALVEAAKSVRDPLSANSVGPWPEGYWQLASALAALEPKP